MALIEGNDGNNSISDTAGDDTIYAYGGNDQVTITYGRDWASGGNGDDILVVSYGDATQSVIVDTIYNHYAWVQTGSGFSDSSRRVAYVGYEHLNVMGGSADDSITGLFNQWDILDGGAGNNSWKDSFSAFGAGLSVDMAQVSSATGQSYADGTTVRNFSVADLILTEQADWFRDAGDHDDIIYSGGGNDDLGTTDGRDFLHGGDGDDIVRINWSDATQTVTVDTVFNTIAWVQTGTGFADSTRRVFYGQVEHLDVTSGSADDHLRGTVDQWDKFDGGAGDDQWIDHFASYGGRIVVDMAQVSSSGGQTLADGTELRNIESAELVLTAQNDVFRDSGDHDDSVESGDGNDRIYATEGRDWANGGTGVDKLTIDWSDAAQDAFLDTVFNTHAWVQTGTGFADSTRRVAYVDIERFDVSFGAGDDSATAANGNDRFRGGLGDDTLDGRGGRDRLSGNGGSDTILGGDGGDFLYGGNGRDTLEGQGGGDDLFGNGGNDLLIGGRGTDMLFGGGRKDILRGEAGGDALDGGLGSDTADYSTSAARVIVDLGTGSARGGDARGDTLTSIENLIGSDGGDRLTGDGGANRLEGGNGADALRGKAGRDRLVGQDGNDRLFGGDADDKLQGDGGDDEMTGGNGSDDFLFADGFGFDSILDFDANDNKEDIDLRAVLSIVDFADLKGNHMSQVGLDVLIDAGGGNTITVLNVDIGDMNAGDFIF